MVNEAKEEFFLDQFKHEEGVFNARLGLFLTTHSILFAAVGIAARVPSLIFVVSMLGVMIGAIWLYLQNRQAFIIRYLDEKLEGCSEFYKELRISVKKSKYGFVSSTAILSIWLPSLMIVAWSAIFIGALVFGVATPGAAATNRPA